MCHSPNRVAIYGYLYNLYKRTCFYTCGSLLLCIEQSNDSQPTLCIWPKPLKNVNSFYTANFLIEAIFNNEMTNAFMAKFASRQLSLLLSGLLPPNLAVL